MPTTVRTPVAVAVAAALVLAGCSTGASDSEAADVQHAASTHPTEPLPPVEVETGVVHVHGLGSTLLTACSTRRRTPGCSGYRTGGRRSGSPTGRRTRWASPWWGPAGSSGRGTRTPREDDVRPPLLGLIESDDAGQTWKRLSLHGRADFHALTAAHGQVHGYDSTSGTFMVTADRERWDRRSRLPLRDSAVDPADQDRIVATTEQGPVASGDGGRTWTSLEGAPALVVLAWTSKAGLHGVAVDGTVYRSGDSGRTWSRTGSAGGPPDAVTVDSRPGAALYVAVAGRGIVVSTDRGRTFTVRDAE